jgi:negative regulator of flagellin synthesis FlgM
MSCTFEDAFMVNPIDDSADSNSVDSENQNSESKWFGLDYFFSTDSSTLDNTSKELNELKASLQDEPEINAARVMYFKQEIASGNYAINSDKLADLLLCNEEAE